MSLGKGREGDRRRVEGIDVLPLFLDFISYKVLALQNSA
jgi:hypothetical protein